ncbi:ArsR family transcriptional regulator [Mycolicibacterium duvalii]|uniref:Transcriptional regulator n=1 Tax=Mycolicibacterium duvalii TaxID=39688 RepID=A0A7I7JVM8_9MYCO|nr:helix-turn-helix domain-containing protein [Mycolicibacterium duvalii]MCV7369982.1 ArsR family transcriptional regulator [Mycolicibacterium duvalii]PEG34863.1 ArsR family transcriptional regulator [Mycolicibacterium duvalii]BBX15917.1 transcriptional regulator [Mycolicibacterium duvalii]
MPLHRTESDASTSDRDRAAGQQRQRVLTLLREAGTPLDAQRVAATLGIHVTTARFHLGALEDRGLVRRRSGDRRAKGAGRPRVTYEMVPRLDYADIVALFARHLGGSAGEREERSLRIGADLAHRVHLPRLGPGSSVVDLVLATLDALGFQVSSVLTSFGEVMIEICTCPLAEIGATAPEVVRGIQQGLIQEVIDINADALGRSYQAQVTPDPRGGACQVSLTVTPVRTPVARERR